MNVIKNLNLKLLSGVYYKFFTSLLLFPKYHKHYSEIQKYCMFIGCPRSGHSLIAALLDAHPKICISLETNVLDLVASGFTKKQIFYLIIKRSKELAFKRNYYWNGYNYFVPNQYQGKINTLKIIGDKKGGKSTRLIGDNPEIINLLREKINLPIKCLHVLRNPFDNISTMITRFIEKGYFLNDSLFQKTISLYFSFVDVNFSLKKNKSINILDIYHEEFIQNTIKSLQNIIGFLGVDADTSYYQECSKIVYKKPHESRYDIEWPDKFRELVLNEIEKYDYLQRYSEEKAF